MNNAFIDLKLNSNIAKGLEKQNITLPTPIQSLTIPVFLEGKDIVAESYTGSGKTLAFVAPLFQKIDSSKREMQAIILAPTHELVMQIHQQITMLAENSGLPITSTPVIGEVHIDKQIKKLRDKPHIIVGSAGRVLDLMTKKKITSHTIKTVVLDEADNLLDQNQANTIKKLLHLTPKNRQLCVFSASISDKTLATAKTFMPDPEVIRTAGKTALNPNIEHMYIVGDKRDKFELLRKLLVATDTQKALIFVSQNTDVATIIEKLKHHHYTATAISGKISKEERKNALSRFKAGKIKLLISSDLSARGLDVPDVTHIFHFDLPLTANDYLHRAGRTARGSLSGTSICIVSPKELGAIRIYEREFGLKIVPIEVSEGQIKPLSAHQLAKLTKATPANTSKEVTKPSNGKNYKSNSKDFTKPSKSTVPTKAPESGKFFKSSKSTAPAKALDSGKFAKSSKHTTSHKSANTSSLSSAMDLIKDAKFGKKYE